MLAKVLEEFDSELWLYGPFTLQSARDRGLQSANVSIRGLIPSCQLLGELHAQVDALFVPMSFEDADRPNIEINFPSKLTDYTATGLPLVIVGPEHCSAVKWARDNQNVAEVMTDLNPNQLRAIIQRLWESPEHRFCLAKTAFNVGERYFGHSAASSLFAESLLRASCSPTQNNPDL